MGCWDWLNNRFFAKPPTVLKFESICAFYAKQGKAFHILWILMMCSALALMHVIHHSIEEDEYGVVQSDDYGRSVVRRACEMARDRLSTGGQMSIEDVKAAIEEHERMGKAD